MLKTLTIALLLACASGLGAEDIEIHPAARIFEDTLTGPREYGLVRAATVDLAEHGIPAAAEQVCISLGIQVTPARDRSAGSAHGLLALGSPASTDGTLAVELDTTTQEIGEDGDWSKYDGGWLPVRTDAEGHRVVEVRWRCGVAGTATVKAGVLIVGYRTAATAPAAPR